MYEYNVITYPKNLNIFKFSGNIESKDFESYKKDLDLILDKKQIFYSFFDILDIKNFNINFLLKQISYIYSKQKSIKMYMKGNIVLVDKSYESVINMTIKLKKPLCPNFVTSNREEGIKFLLLLDN